MATRVRLTPSVLVVNDALHERETFARTLRSAGYHAIPAENSLAAYQIAITRAPDIVVTDVRITRSISGLELTRRLRNNERTSAIGIIVLTTASRPQDADVALKAGADTFLEKPVSTSLLKVAVARILAISNMRLAERFSELDSRPIDSDAQAGISRNVCPNCGDRLAYRKRSPVLTLIATEQQMGGIEFATSLDGFA